MQPTLSNELTPIWTHMGQDSWADLLQNKWGDFTSPITAHLPIHPAHSPDAIHVGPAFEVSRQRIEPGLNANNLAALREVSQQETLLVQFAFGDPPAVPDFRRTSLSLDEGIYPIAGAEYYAYEGLLYRFEYFCCALPDSTSAMPQSLLWIRGSVSNFQDETQAAHVRVKVNFPRGDQVFDYHYAPYYWDASKYPTGNEVSFKGTEISRHGQVMGRVLPAAFTLAWEEQRDFAPSDYGEADFKLSPPHPSLRYSQVRNALNLRQELAPQQTSTFELAFLTNYEAITPAHRVALQNAKSGACRAEAKTHFQQLIPTDAARLEFSAESWEQVFSHLPIGILQLMPRFDGVPGLVPTQGGTSERHFVWVGECAFMMMPLLKLGYLDPVREAIEYVFSLQDAGYPPHGRVTTTAGAVGTSGPKWLNTTGVALALAAEYYAYSHDAIFLDEYLPRLLRAVNWIVGEIRATRVLCEDGKRPLQYGLMPFGCATDGDIGFVIAYTDAYTFWGLEKAVLLLEQIGHVQAGEFRRELESYREDIQYALTGLARDDGFIARAIVTGDADEDLYKSFDQICGAFHLAIGNAVGVDNPLFERYIEYFEKAQKDDIFLGRMDFDTAYMSVAEWVWQEIYLRRGEWKKAFACLQINWKYGKTKAHQTQERFRQSDATFCPWQPNGSANGRLLDMMVKSLYFEYEGTVTLLAGIPFDWLKRNGITALENLHTPRGVLHLKATMRDATCCNVKLSASSSDAMLSFVRFPQHFSVTTAGEDRPIQSSYQIPDGVSCIEFILTNND